MRRFMKIWVGRIKNDFATRFACMHKLTAYYEHIYMSGFMHCPEIATTNFFLFFFPFSLLSYLGYE